MESNLLLEQYSWYKKQQLAKAPFECLLNADIEPNPHQVKKERSRGVETSILSTCNNYKPRWKSNGVFFNRFFGGFVLRATLKSNFVASAMSCSIIEISLLRL